MTTVFVLTGENLTIPFYSFFSENCNQNYKVYTKVPNTQCDGWARTSFDDCKQKCIDNALPDSCNGGDPPKNCSFAVWDDNPHFPPGWCHLAETVCKNENISHGAQVKIWKKTGDYPIKLNSIV
jgi:hypothetical protein